MNMKLKNIIRNVMPPFVIEIARKVRPVAINYSGSYTSWDEASAHAAGYDADTILKRVRTAVSRARNGEVAFERDSVVFTEKQYPFPVLAALLRSALSDGNKLRVLDFGGSLGSTYFQCRDQLFGLSEFTWSIVERKDYVDCGKREFETGELLFFEDISACIQQQKPNLVLISGVLQYLDSPYEVLDRFLDSGIGTIVVDRTPFSDHDDFITIQHARDIYDARFPLWIFNKNKFLQRFNDRYGKVVEFPTVDASADHANGMIHFRGFIFTKK